MANRQQRRAEKRAAVKEARRQSGSRQREQRPSQSRGRQAARALDGFHPLREALGEVARHKGEWAGIPVPLEGQRLIIEPSYPYASLADVGVKELPAEPNPYDNCRIRNRWYSTRWHADMVIFEYPDGRIDWGRPPVCHHLAQSLMTLGASDVWGIEQEGAAVNLLGTMLRHRPFKQYLLTGMFLERSERSGVTYLFRRLKPTVALAADGRPGDSARILAALCMHPIAYYEGSWAGAMCPTDDVIAHLSLMRGDEHMFWRRCNQHPPYRPEAGL